MRQQKTIPAANEMASERSQLIEKLQNEVDFRAVGIEEAEKELENIS